MRERQIAGITRRQSRSLTKADRMAPPAPDLIRRDFTAKMPGLKRVGDITCLPTTEGWLYLATVIDLCTREVAGWSMADHMRTQLMEDAIRMAHAGGHGWQRNLPFGPRIPLHISPSPGTLGRVGCPAKHRPHRFLLRQCRRRELLRRTQIRDRHHGGRPGHRPDKTYSDGSPSITTGNGSTRPSATSPHTRRGFATNDDSTSRHKTEVSDLKGSLQAPPLPPPKARSPRPVSTPPRG